jgi:hypothetical protein
VASDDRKTTESGGEPSAKAGDETTTPAPAPAERMDLPKWNRARVKRAPAKAEGAPEPDAFQAGVREAGRAAVRRGPLVVLGFVAVALGVGAYLWWSKSSDEASAAATRPLAEAAALRHRGRMVDLPPKPPPDPAELEAQIDRKLAETAAADDGEKAQELALLVRASRQIEAADFATAETTYREFLARIGKAHALSFLAQEGIAIAREGQGDLEGALAEIEPLLGNAGDFYRDQALWHKGRLLEALGRSDDALATYQQYAQEFPLDQSSLAKVQVRERLVELDPTTVLPPDPDALAELLGR